MTRRRKHLPKGYDALPVTPEHAVWLDTTARQIFDGASDKPFNVALAAVFLTGMAWAIELMEERTK